MSESVLSDIETLIDRLSIEDEWECFVWYSITEIQQTRRRGSVKSDIPALTTCVQKRMAESRVISRLSKVIYQTDEGAFRLISGHEKRNTNHQWECFIQYPSTSGNLQKTSGISRHKEVFKNSCDPLSSSISMFRNIGWNTSFIAGAFRYSSSNNQLYLSFREIHSSKFQKCYDDHYSISFFLLHVLLTSFRDAT